MPLIGVLNAMVDGNVIFATPHNQNYDAIKTAFNTSAVLTDVVKNITVGHTWSAAQNFVGGITGALTGNVTGNVTGNLTGTVLTGSQANITAIGTLTADLLFTDATYDLGKAGATRPRDGFFSRNVTVGGTLNTGGAITVGAGGITITAGGLTVTAGGVNVTAGGLVMAAGNTVAIGGNNVLGPRSAGWATQTGAQTRADMGGAPTLATVASTLDALIMDLRAHGMI